MVDFGPGTELRGKPRNVDAERPVLGSLLLDQSSISDVSQLLEAEDFWLPRHRIVFGAILEAFERGGHVDVLTVEEVLSRRGELVEVGGREELIGFLNGVVSAAGVGYHAEIVREKSIQRRLLEICEEIAEQAYRNSADPRELLDMAEERIFRIARMSAQQDIKSIEAVLQKTFERIDFFRSQRGELTGLPSGYTELDELTGGLQKGELVIVAARPSMGKTTLALNLAERVAQKGHGVLIFSLEMSAQQVISNMLCGRAQINGQAMRRGRITDGEYDRLQQEAARLYDSPIHVDDGSGLSPATLRAKCRRHRQNQPLALVVVDYLQLMSGGHRVESRQQEIAQISRSLKGLARELEIPVVALSQLNRDVEGREDHRPRMSDMRESGAIEQDADVIMLLHREEYYKRTEENAGLAELIVAKQRNGPTGDVKLRFFAEYMRFENYAGRREPIA